MDVVCKVTTNLPLHGFVHLVSKLFVPLFTHRWVCKALRVNKWVCKASSWKLRYNYTRNNPDVRLREFFWSYRIAKTGNCNDVPDNVTLEFGHLALRCGRRSFDKGVLPRVCSVIRQDKVHLLHFLLGFPCTSVLC